MLRVQRYFRCGGVQGELILATVQVQAVMAVVPNGGSTAVDERCERCWTFYSQWSNSREVGWR